MEYITRFIENKFNRNLLFILCCSLFFLRNIKCFKMMLAFAGVNDYRTLIATGLFMLMDCIISIWFFTCILKNKDTKILLLIFIVNAIYGGVYLIEGELYAFAQYLVFVVPLSMAAYLVVYLNDGIEAFFHNGNKLRIPFVFLGILYILFLSFADVSEHGIAALPEFSYGDVGYAFLFIFIISFCAIFDTKSKFNLTYLIVFAVVIFYTGTRSAILCVFFTVAVYLFLCIIVKIINKEILKKCVLILTVFVLLSQFCNVVMPPGSRLQVVDDNMIAELDDQEQKQRIVWDIEQNQYVMVDDVFIRHIVANDTTYKETEKLLCDDMNNGHGKYIRLNDNQKKWANKYKLHMNRVTLWTAAIGEYEKSPIIGNGALYYQQKYNGTFPHNILLEAMVDFGIIGVVFLMAIVLFFTGAIVVRIKKTKTYGYINMLTLIFAYVPMHLLYTSLYSNGILIFSIISLILMYLKLGKEIEKQGK